MRHALTRLAHGVASGELDADRVDASTVGAFLFTAGMSDPDLLIRPGGEHRLSNFLLYQVARAELYFTPTLWPDFDREQFALALATYADRVAASRARSGR